MPTLPLPRSLLGGVHVRQEESFMVPSLSLRPRLEQMQFCLMDECRVRSRRGTYTDYHVAVVLILVSCW